MNPQSAKPPPAVALRLGAAERGLFALHHAPAAAARGAVVYVPPFVEEMNKARRMAALQARALARDGWHVLQIDLHGTGDSSGDFADASWDGWRSDIAQARAWLRERAGFEPWLFGLRLGALLAADAARERVPPGLLLWQPVLSGRQHVQQFLRLLAGADWAGTARAEQAQASPLERLAKGTPVEVAGYRVAPALALPMADARLELPAALPHLVWLEVSPRTDDTLAPASARLLESAAAGTRVQARVVAGPGFWQSLEIETAPALIDASVAALRECAP